MARVMARAEGSRWQRWLMRGRMGRQFTFTGSISPCQPRASGGLEGLLVHPGRAELHGHGDASGGAANDQAFALLATYALNASTPALRSSFTRFTDGRSEIRLV